MEESQGENPRGESQRNPRGNPWGNPRENPRGIAENPTFQTTCFTVVGLNERNVKALNMGLGFFISSCRIHEPGGLRVATMG